MLRKQQTSVLLMYKRTADDHIWNLGLEHIAPAQAAVAGAQEKLRTLQTKHKRAYSQEARRGAPGPRGHGC